MGMAELQDMRLGTKPKPQTREMRHLRVRVRSQHIPRLLLSLRAHRSTYPPTLQLTLTAPIAPPYYRHVRPFAALVVALVVQPKFGHCLSLTFPVYRGEGSSLCD